jgi:Kef-type K+ transport system membrane component KefB
METLSWVLLDICIIVVVARLFGHIAAKLHQPPVIGEILAGLALGPSLIGLLPGDIEKTLFPTDVASYLNIIAQLGLVLFMFLVGLEIDTSLLRGREGVAGAISLASIAVPFGLGALLAGYLYPLHRTIEGRNVPELAFMLFLGVAMSITAFPVLARILSDRHLQRSTVGTFALASAAIDDVIAWLLLALVIAVIKGDSPVDTLRIVALTALFVGVVYTVGRRLAMQLEHWYRRARGLTPNLLAAVLAGVLISAWVTDKIGIHALFGAFMFGMILPRNDGFVRDILSRLQQISMVLFLPLFFVVLGFGVNIGGLSGGAWGQLFLVVGVAMAGKLTGAYTAARCSRIPRRHSAAIAVLINTRGLTELVILSIGKQLGVLDDQMFTMMVLMALITTAMAGPIVDLLYRPTEAAQGETSSACAGHRMKFEGRTNKTHAK